MNILDCEQGTAPWFAARAGCVTASRICDVMAKIKSGEAAGRRNYRAQLVAEILTGKSLEEGYVSAEMKHGNETEPFARAAYEMETGGFVDKVGFVLHPSLPRCGASPDGLVGDLGMVEIKCPNTATHISYLLEKEIPRDYQLQMFWQMECAERQWCDFVSFDPRLPEHLQLFIKRLERDEVKLEEIKDAVARFLTEVEATVERLEAVRAVTV